MANRHPVPPPAGVARGDRLAIGGVRGESLVNYFNLGSLIREKRLKGESYREITKEVNEAGIIPNGYKISHNTIARWCRDNGLGGDMEAPSDAQMVNVYGTKVKALNLVNDAVNVISVQLDELNKQVGNGTVDVKELKAVIDMLDKMTLRQQTLSSEIGDIQEKVYRYATVAKAMNIINDVLMAKLDQDTYNDVMRALGDNPMLIAALSKIAPSNVKGAKV